MRSLVAAGTFIFLINGVTSQACAQGTAKQIKGNWYCSAVKAITYSNFPGNGSYNKVTHMDASTGECSQKKHLYSGSLSPLSEELSLHIRGPTWLKQAAVYVPTIHQQKISRKFNFHDRRHSHQHLHQHDRAIREIQERELARGVGEIVSAMIDGQLASWKNIYAPPVAATDVPALKEATPKKAHATSLLEPIEGAPERSKAAPLSSSKIVIPLSSSESSTVAATNSNWEDGSWTRQAYYNAAAGVSDGFTFLNHFGGSEGIPGTDDGIGFGASLSYASCDGESGASSPQILSDALIPDGAEIVLMSDKSCDDGGCGYTRPNGVAYHGFGGDHKIFLLEFSMPSSGKAGFNGDMPAIWLLNAQIPLTSQYGDNPDCSCWTSGCGEFDIFEILDSGNFRCKSTLHMAPAGGCSDYFERPTTGTIKAAVVFTGSNEVAHIQILDSAQGFEAVLEARVVEGFTSQDGNSGGYSMFVLGP